MSEQLVLFDVKAESKLAYYGFTLDALEADIALDGYTDINFGKLVGEDSTFELDRRQLAADVDYLLDLYDVSPTGWMPKLVMLELEHDSDINKAAVLRDIERGTLAESLGELVFRLTFDQLTFEPEEEVTGETLAVIALNPSRHLLLTATSSSWENTDTSDDFEVEVSARIQTVV